MNNKNFLFGIFIIMIPLILFVLWYRNYVYNYCKNDIKCLKEKLIFNLDNLNNKLKKYSNKIKEEDKIIVNNNYNNDNNYNYNNDNNDNIEGFFGGLGNWFSGSSPGNLPVSPGSLPNEDLSILEKKINDKMKISNNFPPSDLNGNTDDFKDSDNSEILNSIGSNSIKPPLKKTNVLPNNENNNQNAIFDINNLKKKLPDNILNSKKKLPDNILNSKKELPPSQIIKKPDIKSILGTCQFFNDKCPDKYHELGNFSIQGVGTGSILTCGNVQNTKPARAVAQIKNNSIYEIHITDPGHGFNPSSSPKVSIEGGKGHGATAEAIIDDDGFLKLIKVINPGYNYSETPNILIDAPFMNSSCHLCCADE
jgi:hypothetical protein